MAGEFSDDEHKHVHDIYNEGPLPPGFLIVGREGKVRNIYESSDGLRIALLASDRVSAFDQPSPTLIPGKGEILNNIARHAFEAAAAAGIPIWFEGVPVDNPRLSIGLKGEVLKVEMIYRNYMTGSMWREYRDTGDFAGMNLPKGWQEWQDFTDNPMFTPSTKGKKDINFNPKDVEAMTGMSPKILAKADDLCRPLFALGTEQAAQRGLIIIDTKYEVILLPDGTMVIGDEIHTPDSSRFVYADGFKEAVAAGQRPVSLSKEFLRELILELAGGDMVAAKELMKQPLPPEVVNELIRRYMQLQEVFVG